MLVTNFAGNQYNRKTNTNTNTNTKTAGQQTNCNEYLANSVYSCLLSVALNPAAMCSARSKATRLTHEKIAKLQREDCCFTCKEVGDHQPKCLNGWQPMSILTNVDLALARVIVSKVTMPQPSHVEVENK